MFVDTSGSEMNGGSGPKQAEYHIDAIDGCLSNLHSWYVRPPPSSSSIAYVKSAVCSRTKRQREAHQLLQLAIVPEVLAVRCAKCHTKYRTSKRVVCLKSEGAPCSGFIHSNPARRDP